MARTGGRRRRHVSFEYKHHMEGSPLAAPPDEVAPSASQITRMGPKFNEEMDMMVHPGKWVRNNRARREAIQVSDACGRCFISFHMNATPDR
jgi:hypothetical protein